MGIRRKVLVPLAIVVVAAFGVSSCATGPGSVTGLPNFEDPAVAQGTIGGIILLLAGVITIPQIIDLFINGPDFGPCAFVPGPCG